SSSTNSLAGRVECPMVKNGCAICHFGLPAVLRFFLGRVVDVSFIIHVLRVHPDNSPADSPGLRIPAHPKSRATRPTTWLYTRHVAASMTPAAGNGPANMASTSGPTDYFVDLMFRPAPSTATAGGQRRRRSASHRRARRV